MQEESNFTFENIQNTRLKMAILILTPNILIRTVHLKTEQLVCAFLISFLLVDIENVSMVLQEVRNEFGKNMASVQEVDSNDF